MIRNFELPFLILLSCVVIAVIGAWKNHRMWLQQTIYPAESFLYKFHQSCPNHTPDFFESTLTHALSAQGGVSAQLAFISPQGESATCAAGMVNPYRLSLVADNHRYRYASMTKLVTAGALVKLAANNKLSLDDKLINFLPEITAPTDVRVNNITLRHLLNHEAGFDRTTLLGDTMFIRNRKPWCPDNIEQLAKENLYTDPGSAVNYSNLGYCLLGEVVSRVTKTPFTDHVTSEFNLEARDITFIGDKFLPDEVEYDYRFETDYNHHYLKQFDFLAVASSAGLSGSASAFAQLLDDIYQDFDLGAATAALDACERKQQNTCYESGTRVYREPDTNFVVRAHEGYLPGAASIAVMDQFGGVTVLTKSGANRYQANPDHNWLPWFYQKLAQHYREQGILN